jgi:molecular chaperone HtpG
LPVNKSSKTTLKAMSPNDPPVIIVKPEFMRRMTEMQYMMSAVKGDDDSGFMNHYESIINSNHPVIAQKILSETDVDKRTGLADYVFKLAMLDQQMLSGEELHNFVKKSIQLTTDLK